MFNINSSKGFHMTFSNGWTISVQFGEGNYCDNRSPVVPLRAYEHRESATAEVAVWDPNGEWMQFGANTVIGWQTPDQVAELIRMVQALPARKTHTESSADEPVRLPDCNCPEADNCEHPAPGYRYRSYLNEG